MGEQFRHIGRGSPLHREVTRLYRIAQRLRPSPVDGWSGEIYSRSDDVLGGFHPRSGDLSLSEREVLQHIARPGGAGDAHDRARALVTVLHEAYHGRNEIDAPNEPNAVRTQESRALDEGVIERAARDDFDAFSRQAGYSGLALAGPQSYGAAVAATDRLTEYAAGSERAAQLQSAMLDRPTVMRWDAVADEIVRHRLGDVVPHDATHQQHARAELVNAMAHPNWAGLENARSTSMGRDVGDLAVERMQAAEGRIRAHYRDSPALPYPAVAPNRTAPLRIDGEQHRHAPGPGPQRQVDPVARLALTGTSHPSGAVQSRPDLGDGARGRTGTAPRQPGQTLTPPERTH